MKEANPRLIGLFVIGGIALAVGALLFFSRDDFQSPKRYFVAYFQQSVNGLNTGAPVRFRGIPVGQVTGIAGVYDSDTGNMIPRVIIEFRPEAMENAKVEEGEYTLLPLLLEAGMRASLKSSSLLTGQLYVSLDFRPDVPERYLGSKNNDEYPELPTIDSGLNRTIEKLSSLPLEEVLASVLSTLSAAEELLRNPHIDESLAALPELFSHADATVVDLRQFINQELTTVTSEVNETLAMMRASVQSLTTTLTEDSLVQLSATLAEVDETLQLAQKRLSKDDPLTRELLDALRDVGSAARSVRELADTLEENPETWLRGKKKP